MFLDLSERGPPPEPWTPPPAPEPRRLSPRGERLLMKLIGINLVMMLLLPIGGASLIEVVLWLVRG